MGDEQQPGAWQFGTQARIVDRGHDGLAGTGGGDQQIAVVATSARELDLLEEAFLEWLETEFDTRMTVGPPSVRPARRNSSSNCWGK